MPRYSERIDAPENQATHAGGLLEKQIAHDQTEAHCAFSGFSKQSVPVLRQTLAELFEGRAWVPSNPGELGIGTVPADLCDAVASCPLKENALFVSNEGAGYGHSEMEVMKLLF